MIENSSLEKAVISSLVKQIRIEKLKRHDKLYLDYSYNCDKNFLDFDTLSRNFEKLSRWVGVKGGWTLEQIKVKNYSEVIRNLSRSDINFCGKIFFTLNSCPFFYEKLYWKAIYSGDSRIAKFASNILWKANDSFKVKAQQIFSKVSSVLGFQHITFHHKGNETVGINIDLSKNLLDIEGKTLLTFKKIVDMPACF